MTQNQTPKTVYWLNNTLYLNITNKCSNSCYFCIKNYKQGVCGFNLKLALEPSVEQIIFELSKVLHLHGAKLFSAALASQHRGLTFCLR